MTPALRVEIRTDLGQARGRMIWGIVLAVLGAAVAIWTFHSGNGQIVVLGGGLALGFVVFLSGYTWDMRIRRYLSRHGVPIEAVKDPHH
ncbi:hypothetical protein AB0O64_29525 [Streptomyces sp. NPDC088341]|uniref:hypothetical protein n=1 Tax=Streptomyces sp. NPDC088341 TaxID=3154870 RepID=UPI003412EF8D